MTVLATTDAAAAAAAVHYAIGYHGDLDADFSCRARARRRVNFRPVI